MTPHDARLDELFVRYWDNALSNEELEELADALRCDSLARERFQLFSSIAVLACEPAGFPPAEQFLPAPSPAIEPHRVESEQPSRRRFFKYAGVGMAAGVAGIATGWWSHREDAIPSAKLLDFHGAISLGNRTPEAGAVLPPGSTITTAVLESSAVISTANGARLQIPGNSTITLGEDGQSWRLSRGHVAATVPELVTKTKLSIATDDAVFEVGGEFNPDDGIAMVIGRQNRMTDLCVEKGHVLVSHPISGAKLAVASLGDYVTVQSETAKVTREQRRIVPDTFRLDIAEPLPKRWEVGARTVGNDGPLLHPEFWYDRHYGREMWEIRSDQQWTRGFARIENDSRIRLRFKVARPGTVEVCLCVRTHFATNFKHSQGVLGLEIETAERQPNAWHWVELRATDLLVHKDRPHFEAPWVAHLIILNTFETDLGLEVSNFEIIRPMLGGRV